MKIVLSDQDALVINDILVTNLNRQVQQVMFAQSPEQAQMIQAGLILTSNAQASLVDTLYKAEHGAEVEFQDDFGKFVAMLAHQQLSYYKTVQKRSLETGDGIIEELTEQEQIMKDLLDKLPEVDYDEPEETGLVGPDGNPIIS